MVLTRLFIFCASTGSRTEILLFLFIGMLQTPEEDIQATGGIKIRLSLLF